MLIRTIIVDDESQAISALRQELHLHFEEVEIMDECKTVGDAIISIKKHKPDLVFLDIQIGQRLGFEVLQSVKEEQCGIIFTTAYEEYAIRAIKFSALDYLLKPIDWMELAKTLERFKEIKSKHEGIIKQLSILEKKSSGSSDSIALKTSNGIEFVHLADILYCSALGNYTNYVLKNRRLVIKSTLSSTMELLSESLFLRVHHSHIVNLQHVVSVDYKNYQVELNDKTVLPVSTRKLKQVKEAILEFQKGKIF